MHRITARVGPTVADDGHPNFNQAEHPMTRIVRIIAVATFSLVLAMCSLAGHASAQKPLFEVETGDATKLLQVAEDAGFVVTGSLNAGTIPASGQGVRLMWYPKKAAFRAGGVGSNAWDDPSIGLASMALGSNTVAKGDFSTALGSMTAATGRHSTAMGSGTVASGENATAFGEGTIAGNTGSTAMGLGTEAAGNSSTAMGTRTKATGQASTAFGGGSTASGSYSTATGYATSASGDQSTAMGLNAVASGTNSTAVGSNTRAGGEASTAMGSESQASGVRSTAMGSRTAAGGLASTAMGASTIASGDFSTAMGFDTHATGVSSTAMGAASTAAGLGSVAIGTRAVAQGAGSFVFADRSSTTEPYTASDNQFLVRAHGGIGLNSGTNIGCDLPAGVGAWACTSSRLAKEGFENMDGETVLAKLARIPIQRWYYLGTPAAHVGPTAEDFHAAFGLGQGPTTITTVDADGIALLGVQTLERRTAELSAETAELLRRIEALEAERSAAALPHRTWK